MATQKNELLRGNLYAHILYYPVFSPLSFSDQNKTKNEPISFFVLQICYSNKFLCIYKYFSVDLAILQSHHSPVVDKSLQMPNLEQLPHHYPGNRSGRLLPHTLFILFHTLFKVFIKGNSTFH